MVDEYSQTEIADLLGKTPAAVRQNVLAARRALVPRLSAARKSKIEGTEACLV
jgi:predicted transcriptional regulator